MADTKQAEELGATEAADRKPAARRPLPIVWGLLLLAYPLTAFGLMWAVRTAPCTRIFSAFGHDVTLAQLHTIFFMYSVIGLIAVPAILLIEMQAVGWRASSLRALLTRRNASGQSDAACFVLVHLRLMYPVQILMTGGLALISGAMIRNGLGLPLGLPLSADFVPLPLRLAAYFLLYTLLDYLAHRIDHTALFWPIHRYHHGAEDFHVLTADRGHPAAVLTQSGIKIFPMAVLGVPLDVIIDLSMLAAAINYLNHSRIDWDFGWFGRYVLQSPRHHRLHHAIGAREAYNLSLCPLWDRLGGTWRDVPDGEIRVGTSEPYRHGAFIVPDLLRDYAAFLAGFVRAIGVPRALARRRG